MTSYEEFCASFLTNFPGVAVPPAWEEDKRSALARRQTELLRLREEARDLQARIEQEEFYIKYLEKCLADAEIQRRKLQTPPTLDSLGESLNEREAEATSSSLPTPAGVNYITVIKVKEGTASDTPSQVFEPPRVKKNPPPVPKRTVRSLSTDAHNSEHIPQSSTVQSPHISPKVEVPPSNRRQSAPPGAYTPLAGGGFLGSPISSIPSVQEDTAEISSIPVARDRRLLPTHQRNSDSDGDVKEKEHPTDDEEDNLYDTVGGEIEVSRGSVDNCLLIIAKLCTIAHAGGLCNILQTRILTRIACRKLFVIPVICKMKLVCIDISGFFFQSTRRSDSIIVQTCV